MNKSEPDVVNQLEDNWERVANLQHTTRRVYGSLESVTAVFHDLCHRVLKTQMALTKDGICYNSSQP
jgi:hypothetical protein